MWRTIIGCWPGLQVGLLSFTGGLVCGKFGVGCVVGAIALVTLPCKCGLDSGSNQIHDHIKNQVNKMKSEDHLGKPMIKINKKVGVSR